MGGIAIGLGMLGEKYDDAMIKVQNFGELTNEQSDKVQQAFLNISNQGGASFTQLAAATGQYEGVIKGLPGQMTDIGQKTQVVVQASKDLAEATGGNIGSALSAVIPLMQAYQQPVEKAADVSNQLMDVSSKTGLSVDTLSNVFVRTKSRLGDLAPGMGDMGALLEDLASHGITGQRALMGVNTGLSALFSQTPATTKELQSLGIVIQDNNGKFLPLPQLLDNIREKTSAMTQAQRQQALAHIFGTQAGALFGSLLNDQAGTLEKYKDNLEKSTAAEDGAKRATETVGYQFEKVKNIMENTGAVIGEKIAPYLVQMATEFANVTSKVMKFVEALSSHLGFLKEFIAPLGLIIGGIVAFAGAAAALTPIIAAIIPVVLALFSPLGLVLGAIALLAVAWAKDWGGIREKVESVVQAILPRLREFASFLVSGFHYAFTLVRDAVITFKEALSGNWSDDSKIRPLHRAVGEFGLLLHNVVIPGVKNFAHTLTTEIIPAAQRVAGFISGTVIPAVVRFGTEAKTWIEGTLIPAFQRFATDALPKLEAFGSWILGTAVPAIVKFGTEAKNWFEGTLVPALKTIGDTIETQVKPNFEHLWQSIKEAGKVIEENFSPMVTKAKGILLELKDTLEPQVVGALKAIWNVIQTYVLPIVKTLIEDYFKVLAKVAQSELIVGLKVFADFMSGAVHAAVDLVIGIIKVLLDNLKTIVDVFKNTVQLIDDLVHGKWQAAWDDAKRLVMQFITDLKNTFKDAATWLIAAGEDIVKGLIKGITDMSDAAVKAAEGVGKSIINKIKSFGLSPWPSMVASGQDVVQGLVNGMSSTQQKAAEQAANVAKSITAAMTSELNFASLSTKFQASGAQLPSMAFVDQLVNFAREVAIKMEKATEGMQKADAAAISLSSALSTPFTILDNTMKFITDYGAFLKNKGDVALGQLTGGVLDSLFTLAKTVGDTLEAVTNGMNQNDVTALQYAQALSGPFTVLNDAMTFVTNAGKFLGEKGDQALALIKGSMLDSLITLAKTVGDTLEAVTNGMNQDDVAALQTAQALSGPFTVLNDAMTLVQNVAAFTQAKGQEAFRFVSGPLLDTLVQIAKEVGDTLEAVTNGMNQADVQALQYAQSLAGPFTVLNDAMTFVQNVGGFVANQGLAAIKLVSGPLVNALVGIAREVSLMLETVIGKMSDADIKALQAVTVLQGPFTVLNDAITFIQNAAKLPTVGRTGKLIADDVLKALMELVTAVTAAFVEAGKAMDGTAQKAAQDFAATVKPVFDALTPVFAAFEQLRAMTEIPKQHMNAFVTNFEEALAIIPQLIPAAQASLSQANAFVSVANQIAKAVQDGASVLAAVGVQVQINNVVVGSSSGSPTSGGSVSSSGGSPSGGSAPSPALMAVGSPTSGGSYGFHPGPNGTMISDQYTQGGLTVNLNSNVNVDGQTIAKVNDKYTHQEQLRRPV